MIGLFVNIGSRNRLLEKTEVELAESCNYSWIIGDKKLPMLGLC